MRSSFWMRRAAAAAGLLAAVACGPRAAIPPLPHAPVPIAMTASPAETSLAKALAPVLYLQADESFQLARAVAVVHPDSQVIAYHLLWRDDAHGAWIPFTVPTDQEVVWVGYDSTGAPTRLWTYWHGSILNAAWHGRQPAVDVQWGKHGSLPHRTHLGDLPLDQRLGVYYALSWALPDLWLGRASREGPLCFCGGYRRYRDFSEPRLLGPSLDAIVRAADPGTMLRRVFGERYSEKPEWPWEA
ncbi:MAG TPA: hypothetical protein VFY16_07860 [Gemmatimonadaceae bacterium]|nr:hypothetical protein [Gemmatimonadaceae bacterium]